MILSARQTVYVQSTYLQSVLGDSTACFSQLKINFDNRENSSEVRSLAQAALVKQINGTENSGSSTEVNFHDRVWVIYRITAPDDAKATDIARLQFFDDGKAIGTATLMLNVKQ